MRYILVGLIIISVATGFMLAAYVFELGLEQVLERHGPGMTVIAGLSMVPLFLCIAVLFDKRSGPPRR
jgi:hypothetical protein